MPQPRSWLVCAAARTRAAPKCVHKNATTEPGSWGVNIPTLACQAARFAGRGIATFRVQATAAAVRHGDSTVRGPAHLAKQFPKKRTWVDQGGKGVAHRGLRSNVLTCLRTSRAGRRKDEGNGTLAFSTSKIFMLAEIKNPTWLVGTQPAWR